LTALHVDLTGLQGVC